MRKKALFVLLALFFFSLFNTRSFSHKLQNPEWKRVRSGATMEAILLLYRFNSKRVHPPREVWGYYGTGGPSPGVVFCGKGRKRGGEYHKKDMTFVFFSVGETEYIARLHGQEGIEIRKKTGWFNSEPVSGIQFPLWLPQALSLLQSKTKHNLREMLSRVNGRYTHSTVEGEPFFDDTD